MKNSPILLPLLALFLPICVKAQQTLDVNVYHPDAMYRIPYVPIRNTNAPVLRPTYNPLQTALEALQLKEEMGKSTDSKRNKKSSNISNGPYVSTQKTGYRLPNGQIRYEQYNPITHELDLTDSAGNATGYITQISANRFNVLDNKRILIAYLIRNFRVIKKYTPNGKLISKKKIKK
ncbi:MAG: hypothetical protein ACREHG_00335 [Candidatus Saccharimonadales bacterium]